MRFKYVKTTIKFGIIFKKQQKNRTFAVHFITPRDGFPH